MSSDDNLVEGNIIGVGYNASNQLTAIPNAIAGVILSNADSNTIGGTSFGAANVISGNSLDGIILVNDAIGNAILANLIGTNTSSTGAIGNSADGVFLQGSSTITISGVAPNTTSSTISGNTIKGNVIAGNIANGIQFLGVDSTANTITSNWIGLSPNGTPIANGADGVLLNDVGPANVVGGVGQGNIISGNKQDGVEITGSPATLNGTLISGNYIGTDPSGTHAVGNGADGVLLLGSSANTIGGATTLPGTGLGNVIAGNSHAGVEIDNPGETPADKNVVVGNLIGTNAAGTAGLGNGSSGVQIDNASGNSLGGASSGDRNIISGNAGNGVLVVQSQNLTASGNQILGNYIGTNANGTGSLGNLGSGVVLADGSANLVGGISGGATLLNTEAPSGAGQAGEPGNLISGNNDWGIVIQLTGASAGQPQSLIQGNVIGLDATQTVAIGNGQGGILVNNLSTQSIGQTIGGTAAGAGNIITGNTNFGIDIFGPQYGGSGQNDVVQGNLIGLNAGGQVVSGAGSTGNGTGILVDNSPNDLIGGSSPAGRNVISGNGQAGIELSGVFSAGDDVLGNFIGTNLAGDAFPAPSTEAAQARASG